MPLNIQIKYNAWNNVSQYLKFRINKMYHTFSCHMLYYLPKHINEMTTIKLLRKLILSAISSQDLGQSNVILWTEKFHFTVLAVLFKVRIFQGIGLFLFCFLTKVDSILWKEFLWYGVFLTDEYRISSTCDFPQEMPQLVKKELDGAFCPRAWSDFIWIAKDVLSSLFSHIPGNFWSI